MAGCRAGVNRGEIDGRVIRSGASRYVQRVEQGQKINYGVEPSLIRHFRAMLWNWNQVVALDKPFLDICICTHNPRKYIFDIVLGSILKQASYSRAFSVLIVDNGSIPPVDSKVLDKLVAAGVSARIVREPDLGNSQARKRAIEETRAPWILFVDDDNEIADEYLAGGVDFIENHPDVGCFGGKLLLPSNISPPDWTKPLIEYLAIKDIGDEPIVAKSPVWGEWEPPAAGAWVRRDVAQFYVNRLEKDVRSAELGRRGQEGLASCEDSLMMRGAYHLGLANAYCPAISLTHHLAGHRFDFEYLLSLMAGYGRSIVLLEDLLGSEHGNEIAYDDPGAFSALLDDIMRDTSQSGLVRVCEIARHIFGRQKHRELDFLHQQNDKPFTLVTPCLNAVKTIERTLDSIAQQKYKHLQYIVCDGGSTDGTLDVLKAFDSIIDILIVGQDKNVADALNKGFARATGEIRGYINADDCLAPDALKKIASLFAKWPDADVITGSCQRWYADGTGTVTHVPGNFLTTMALRNNIEQPSTFWRKEAQDKAGPFDDSFQLSFDWEYWNRLVKSGARFRQTKRMLSTYYFSDENLTSRGGAKVIDEMYRITKMYAGDGGRIADMYMDLFKNFDLKGYYDVDFDELPEEKRKLFACKLQELSREYDEGTIQAYNWNWASRQIRGLKWY